VLFVIVQPMGAVEYGVGFTCSCGYHHPAGGLRVELTDEQRRSGVPLFCPRCSTLAVRWCPPVTAQDVEHAQQRQLVRLVCAECLAQAEVPHAAVSSSTLCPVCGSRKLSPIA
jgi:hypothetical protein